MTTSRARPRRPAIYAKLLDVDKVDLLFAPYATVPTAPIMPLVKQRGLLLMGNFSFQVNSKVKHDMWFNNAPWGPADSWAASFIDIGTKAGGKSIAILAADQEFAQNVAKTAKAVAEERSHAARLSSRTIRPTRSSSRHDPRAQGGQARHGLRRILSAGFGRHPARRKRDRRRRQRQGLRRRHGRPAVRRVTGIMGSLLNGVVNYNSWLPEPSMYFDGTKEFFAKYTPRAIEAKVDPLGYYLAPFGYAMGQMIEAAVNATKSLDQKAIAKYLRENEHKTIVGPIAFAADGERKDSATLQAQFRGVDRQEHRAVQAPPASR